MNAQVMLFGAIVVATSICASDTAVARDPVSPYDLSSEDYWQTRRISVAELVEIDKQEPLTPMVVFRLLKPINDDSGAHLQFGTGSKRTLPVPHNFACRCAFFQRRALR